MRAAVNDDTNGRARCGASASQWLAATLIFAGCGTSSTGAPGTDGAIKDGGSNDVATSLPGNAIHGTVMGMLFSAVSSSYWVQNPSPGGAPTLVFLADESLSCQSLSVSGWDKTLGANTQLLEIGLPGPTASTFHILMDADANYLGGPYNPSADAGSITITAVNVGQSLDGTFDLAFGTDALRGTFDAHFCPSGVEP
jgi:hypothetical protein